ncbi:MAG: aminopeptidase [Muribaculaceae bacterium]|nr:aminopeptidase [Muribaculaceae bacterium]
MKHFIAAIMAIGCVGASWAAADEAKPDSTGFTFTDVKLVKTTPVKDQNKSGTCWCFSGLSFFEDEILRKTGKEVDLSEMFVVRHCYDDKADKYIRTNGKVNFSQGGSVLDPAYVWEFYGIVPEEAYKGLNYGEDKHSHYEMADVLTSYVNSVSRNANKRISTAWRKGFNGVLDAYLGEYPTTFTYEGKTYTPRSFAESLPINLNDYIAITSFTHHPYYKPFALELADNWLWGQYYNVPLDEMKAVVDNAIDNGYSVVWAADVSEGGFKWTKGYALMPKGKTEADMDNTELSRWVKLSDKEREKQKYDINGPVEEITVTPESRQAMFDRQETTDDHGMVIIGKAVDQNGNKYYKVKNSWDTNQIYDGYFYVSEPYFLAKTIDIYVNKEAVPQSIKTKLGVQ